MMTSETDEQFVERMVNEWGEWAGSPANARLFALARRGASAADIRAMKGKPWKCPINHPGCTSNCGSYGCGN